VHLVQPPDQSHDRNPVVRPSGNILFARWDHMADTRRFAVFRAKPDGTDRFLRYGEPSTGNGYLHPRDMDPSRPDKGFIASSLIRRKGRQPLFQPLHVDAEVVGGHDRHGGRCGHRPGSRRWRGQGLGSGLASSNSAG